MLSFPSIPVPQQSFLSPGDVQKPFAGSFQQCREMGGVVVPKNLSAYIIKIKRQVTAD